MRLLRLGLGVPAASPGRSGPPGSRVLAPLLGVALGAGCMMACDKKEASVVAAGTDGAIAVKVDDQGFTPSSVTFKKGAPATMVFTRTSEDTCATEVVFPQLDIKKDLPKGKPVVVSIPTDKEQTLTFQCGMGMYKSSVAVTVN